ncbi:hypothetical protein BO70DRAFT_361397, partial [Aspergillus heteromorphus CBS 117.55]
MVTRGIWHLHTDSKPEQPLHRKMVLLLPSPAEPNNFPRLPRHPNQNPAISARDSPPEMARSPTSLTAAYRPRLRVYHRSRQRIFNRDSVVGWSGGGGLGRRVRRVALD